MIVDKLALIAGLDYSYIAEVAGRNIIAIFTTYPSLFAELNEV